VAENAHSWLPMLIHEMDYKTTRVAMDGVAQDPPASCRFAHRSTVRERFFGAAMDEFMAL
jgi:hypothetical protein